jgi:hypothetical protein
MTFDHMTDQLTVGSLPPPPTLTVEMVDTCTDRIMIMLSNCYTMNQHMCSKVAWTTNFEIAVNFCGIKTIQRSMVIVCRCCFQLRISVDAFILSISIKYTSSDIMKEIKGKPDWP